MFVLFIVAIAIQSVVTPFLYNKVHSKCWASAIRLVITEICYVVTSVGMSTAGLGMQGMQARGLTVRP